MSTALPTPSSPPPGLTLSEQVLVERYKDIAKRIRAQNENVHKYLALFQTLVVAIVVAGGAIVMSWRSLNISPETAQVSIRGLEYLLAILGVFMAGSVVAGIRTWFDYRADEVEVLNRVMGPGYRRPPTLRNLWRWPETYLLVFVVAVVGLICGFVERSVIPVIQ